MINKGALNVFARLSTRPSVHLPIAQVLYSFCLAPHTRTAVVEAGCTATLLQFLLEHSEPRAQEQVCFAAKALIQLAGGSITGATVDSNSDLQVHDYLSQQASGELIE
jgi:hypothetical protein